MCMNCRKRSASGIEAMDGKALFATDDWERAEGKGGGGKTKTIINGNVFEKGGVNTSVVFGKVTDKMRTGLNMMAIHGSPAVCRS
jgi:coproporphyrinogen III oxidase